MAANANTILKDWGNTLIQWEFAMDHAGGFDDLRMDDYERLVRQLACLHEAVLEIRLKLRDTSTPHEKIQYPNLYK